MSCRTCVHFACRAGWWCTLVSIPTLQTMGYQISEDSLPNPEDFVCDDYEPP